MQHTVFLCPVWCVCCAFQTLSNLGDALVALGEAALAAGDAAAGQDAFEVGGCSCKATVVHCDQQRAVGMWQTAGCTGVPRCSQCLANPNQHRKQQATCSSH